MIFIIGCESFVGKYLIKEYIIKNTHRFIKSGGYLVIEDIYRFRKGYEESRYYEKLKYLKKIFSNTC